MSKSTIAQVTQIVQRITGKWRGAPPVTIVNTPADLPVKAPSDVRGMWRQGQAFIVATQSLVGVEDTLAHEIIGHHGMREALGRSWRSFMFGVQSGARSGDSKLRCFREDVRSAYTDESGACNLSPLVESDEIAAAVAESRFNGVTGRMQVQQPLKKRLLAAAGHFSREILYRDVPVSFDELLGRLLTAEQRLRFGGAFFGLGARLKNWYAPPMPAPKPLDRYRPPMDLQESERLLREDDGRRNYWSDIKMSATIVGAGVLALMVVCGFIIGILQAIHIL